MDSIKSKLPALEKKGEGLRNQVSGMFSRDKRAEPTHAPRPISELRDPASYGPPPKRRVEPPPSIPARQAQPPERLQSRFGSEGTAQLTRPPPPLPATQSKKPPPALPPRLPPRGNTSPTTTAPTQGHQPGSGLLNQGAINRLGGAGISVPGLGIGKSASSPQSPPAQGTTWAEKQAALKTAADFHKDPSKVSLDDAKSAASTFNNFRQRHGEQVVAGARTASSLNQKYGIADRVGGLAGSQHHGATAGTEQSALSALQTKKKPPPPPPPKRQGGGSANILPPPVPSNTRPQF